MQINECCDSEDGCPRCKGYGYLVRCDVCGEMFPLGRLPQPGEHSTYFACQACRSACHQCGKRVEWVALVWLETPGRLGRRANEQRLCNACLTACDDRDEIVPNTTRVIKDGE